MEKNNKDDDFSLDAYQDIFKDLDLLMSKIRTKVPETYAINKQLCFQRLKEAHHWLTDLYELHNPPEFKIGTTKPPERRI